MRYVFIDIECSNCFEGIGKICEIGYVITDTDFQVLKKEDILINPGNKPQDRFHLAGRNGSEGITLAHSKEEYNAAPFYDHFYDNLKFLLTQKDILIFGFSIQNDIGYINANNRRYSLPQFDFNSYDVQRMYSKYKDGHLSKSIGLDKAINDVSKDINKVRFHKPDDDAYMTMLLLKEMCHQMEMSLDDWLFLCPESKIDKDGKPFLNITKQKVKSLKKIIAPREKCKNEEFNGYYNKVVDSNDNLPLSGITFSLSVEIKKDIDCALYLARHIYSRGGTTVRSLNSKYLVVKDDDDYQRLKSIIDFSKIEPIFIQQVLGNT